MFRFELGVVDRPEDMPKWITNEYLQKCTDNQDLQKNWQPKTGDWYFCRDIYAVRQILDLDKYYSEGEVPPLKTDHGKDDKGHWMCDVYLPVPMKNYIATYVVKPSMHVRGYGGENKHAFNKRMSNDILEALENRFPMMQNKDSLNSSIACRFSLPEDVEVDSAKIREDLLLQVEEEKKVYTIPEQPHSIAGVSSTESV